MARSDGPASHTTSHVGREPLKRGYPGFPRCGARAGTRDRAPELGREGCRPRCCGHPAYRVQRASVGPAAGPGSEDTGCMSPGTPAQPPPSSPLAAPLSWPHVLGSQVRCLPVAAGLRQPPQGPPGTQPPRPRGSVGPGRLTTWLTLDPAGTAASTGSTSPCRPLRSAQAKAVRKRGPSSGLAQPLSRHLALRTQVPRLPRALGTPGSWATCVGASGHWEHLSRGCGRLGDSKDSGF